MPTFNEALYSLQGQDIYVSCEPDILDFTSEKRPAKLIIHSQSFKIEVPLDGEQHKLRETISRLQTFLGGENAIIMSWHWKNFLSYCRGKTGLDFIIQGRLFELSCLESYVGLSFEKPKSFMEAKGRLGNLTKKKKWDKIYKIYEAVYLPLIYTLPKIETCGLLHKEKKTKVYPYYEIDGQINGRLKASNAFQFAYNPHNTGPEERANIRPISWGDEQFMVFDFKHMEVSVLYWLTQDDVMGELLNSGDFYEACWNALMPSVPCNSHHRETCKEFFLPVVFGLGADSLSQKISWPLVQCQRLIERIYDTFSIAMSWIKRQQNSLFDGMAYDHFFRCRLFDNSYKIRNFCVQSPAALICLHKLIELVKYLENAKVCMHIHDGYVIIVKKCDFDQTYKTAKEILETEHELYPGLKLKTSCSVGASLNDLKKY